MSCFSFPRISIVSVCAMCNQCRYLWSWRVKSFTLLAYLVALIESKAYFVPASHSVTTIGDGGYEDQAAQQANDYAVREGSESSIIPSIQPADLGFFSSGGYGVKKKRKFIDNYNFGVPFKDHYDEYPMLPSPPIALEHIKSSDNRGVQHTNTKLAHIGSIIASTLKYMLITMLVIGVPALFIHYVVIPLKLLIGLKMLALANAVTLGTLAAKHMIKDKHGSGGHGYGSGNGGGGSGGSTIGGLLGGLSAISTPIVAPNIQQPITQPITQLVSNPTQQLQNVETFNSFPYWFPLLLYYANLTSGSGSNSNSNSNSNTNTNSNSNTNTNTNTNTNNNQNNNNNHNNNNNNNHNNNHNHNHNNNNNNNNERIKLPTKLRKTKILGIEPLQTEDFKNMTEGDVRAVMTFLKRKNKKVMIL